ncbi:MAG: class I SAM-dependent methyltransferase [Patescibacteria group bacterium]
MKSTDIHHLKNVQYKSLDGLKKRWKTYEYLNPSFDIYGDAIKKLDLTGAESVLEVGCGSGEVLSRMAANGHSGKLIGLDIHENIFSEFHTNIEFIVGSADSIPYPDESFDVVLAFFMVYHMPDPQSAIKEWVRVLKKGGKLIITAATIGNKSKIKSLKEKAANTQSKEVHKLTANCTFEKATELVDSILNNQYTHVYKSELQIPDTKIVLDSIDSVRDTFHPHPTDAEWQEAMGLMQNEINSEIRKNGYFSDKVERGLSVSEK